ncbi:hypothetical protein MMC25_004388 [Agyrium rufum]|nr:hypothetical protein [Agyrium rufum]
MPFINLPSKPDSPLAYELLDGFNESAHTPLVVFINGLGIPAISWKPTIALLQTSQTLSPKPSILTYDRFGQGATTARDLLDSQPGKDTGYGHDLQDSVNDLHELLQTIAPSERSTTIFVAASIGVHIARLYAHNHPGAIAGLLFLDSNIGNAEFTDFWPNPYASDFNLEDVLADDCSMEQYTEAYTRLGKMFNSDVRNPEGLDRRNVKSLLPDPSKPKLVGPDGRMGPWLTVVGHDPEFFAQENLMMIKVPVSITRKYTQPAWHRYNEALLQISDPERTTGVIFAPNASHFIQKDNPAFVAEQIAMLLQKVQNQ